MKPEKIKAVFRFYRETLEKRFGLQPQQLHPDKYSQEGIVGGIGPAVQHCLWMCDQARKDWPGIEFSWEVSGQESVSDLAPVLDEWMDDDDEADWEWGDETMEDPRRRQIWGDDDE